MSTATIIHPASAGQTRTRVVTDHERHANDWYVDPAWCTKLLLNAVQFDRKIWDPCCGGGTIPKEARRLGYDAHGSDLVARGYGESHCDFFRSRGPFDNLVFNPPYKLAEEFIAYANHIATGKVAALVNLKFLASQGRRKRLFDPHPPLAVLILSRRPSMPPGGAGIEAKGGTADYCWIVWERGYVGPTNTRWLA